MRERKPINAADITFLRLPDAAAKEAVSFVGEGFREDHRCVHSARTVPGWAYGIPSFPICIKMQSFMQNSQQIRAAMRQIRDLRGLSARGVWNDPKETPLTGLFLTGYSGGGKKMIAEYESPEKPELYNTPRIYGLNLKHKTPPGDAEDLRT